MKQSLQLRLGHHLAMTPQLQQAIRLLQLSTLELHTEIQQALESNPMLETEEEFEAEQEKNSTDQEGVDSHNASEASSEAGDNTTEDWNQDTLPDDLPVDSVWEDVYDTVAAAGSTSASPEPDSRPMEIQDNGETLRDHLYWQMGLSRFSETDTTIATAIIDSIDEDGYLSTPLEEIWNGLKDEEIEFDEVEAVLHAIQQFDPPGVAARDLRECMLLQMAQLDPDTPWLKEALQLVSHHLDLLASHDYNQLMKKMRLSQGELAQAVNVIIGLNPRPGGQIAPSVTEYVIPDVVVKKHKGKWRVELNPEAVPRLRVNQQYAGLVKSSKNSSDNNYIKGQLQEARWFIKSLMSRNETLLKVASCIVERQQGFLEHGEEAMKALVLHDVAESVGMHESTISRVTTRKYMHTPRGIFELKYFFSSHVSTSSGGECSATAIRAFIKKMVAEEDPRKPLSDNKIATILSQQGIEVARRTIAKYREGMSIPPSNERKRLVK